MHIVLAGAASRFQQISYFLFKHKQILHDMKFTVFDGLDNCKWNGGRINSNCSLTKEQEQFYVNNNVGINLIFTNNIIDVNDVTGNALLERFHKPGNGVVLVNDDLRKYIRINFPKYKITFSITGTDDISMPMSQKDFNHYTDLEEKYDYIVPRAEHNLDDKLKDLDKSKYEIYVTEGCVPCCPVWTKHYNYIAEGNREENNYTPEIAKKYENCMLKCSEGDLRWDKLNFDTLLNSTDEIMKLYSSGFSRFKISGRGFLESQLSIKNGITNAGFQDRLDMILNLYNNIK